MHKITVEQIDELVRLANEYEAAKYELQTGNAAPAYSKYLMIVLPKDRLIEAAQVLGVAVTERFHEEVFCDFTELSFVYKDVKFFDHVSEDTGL